MRKAITRILIKLAMRTCVNGFCYDCLKDAYRNEI